MKYLNKIDLRKYGARRKIAHMSLGTTLVLLMFSNTIISQNIEVFMLFLLLLGIMISAIAKYFKPHILMKFLVLFDKREDLKKFPAKGAVYFVIGALISIMLFEKRISAASILILAYGDPFAYFIGRYFGKRRLIINKKKLLEGTLGGTIAATFAAAFVVPLPIAFYGASMGMIAEAIELEFTNLDDNFFIPFVSGIVMSVIVSFV